MREDEQDFVLGKGLEQARIDDGVGVLGTCCMGADALALVNEEFRVRARRVEGFDGPLEQQVELRVLVGGDADVVNKVEGVFGRLGRRL
nr:hypothetical protein [Deinococcus hopiensis]